MTNTTRRELLTVGVAVAMLIARFTLNDTATLVAVYVSLFVACMIEGVIYIAPMVKVAMQATIKNTYMPKHKKGHIKRVIVK